MLQSVVLNVSSDAVGRGFTVFVTTPVMSPAWFPEQLSALLTTVTKYTLLLATFALKLFVG